MALSGAAGPAPAERQRFATYAWQREGGKHAAGRTLPPDAAVLSGDGGEGGPAQAVFSEAKGEERAVRSAGGRCHRAVRPPLMSGRRPVLDWCRVVVE